MCVRVSVIIIPPRKVVRGRPARKNVEEPEVPSSPNVKPQGEVTNAEFHYSDDSQIDFKYTKDV